MFDTTARHTPEYAIEAALLGVFMVAACFFATLLEHPGAWGRKTIASPFVRRALMGLAMGATAVLLIYSPWGMRSGAHMNPATTLTFLRLGKIDAVDAVFYMLAQFAGGTAGVALSWLMLRSRLAHPTVQFVVTIPGARGVGVAWLAEGAIAFGMMFLVLYASNDAPLTRYTGLFAGTAVALFITFEAPLSGMSLNPARSFASAIVARHWRAFWVYLTAPIIGMLAASFAYTGLPSHNHVYCAKLCHGSDERCIFRCEFDQIGR